MIVVLGISLNKNELHHSQTKLSFVLKISPSGHFKISCLCNSVFTLRVKTCYHRKQISKFG